MDLHGRVVLLTGGKRIGAAVAAELARGGADVALTCHTSPTEAEQAAATVRAHGRRALVLAADLAEASACTRVVAETVAAFGRLDILINMASIYRAVPLEEVTVKAWDAQMAVDLRAAWLCAQAAVPHMRRLRGGRIINFSDWVARSGRPRYPGFLTYYVAKAGVIALTEALALELAADQILVNAVAPGPIIAPEGSLEEERERIARATPVQRWGGAGEIAKIVRALVESDFITGETVRVDGGRHVR